MSWQFTVGLRVKRKADRIVVDAEDALIAALSLRPQSCMCAGRTNAATYVTRLKSSRSRWPWMITHEFHDGDHLWPGELGRRLH